MTVSLAVCALSQCETTWEPSPKLNAQAAVVRQISKSERALKFTERILASRNWEDTVGRAGFSIYIGKWQWESLSPMRNWKSRLTFARREVARMVESPLRHINRRLCFQGADQDE